MENKITKLDLIRGYTYVVLTLDSWNQIPRKLVVCWLIPIFHLHFERLIWGSPFYELVVSLSFAFNCSGKPGTHARHVILFYYFFFLCFRLHIFLLHCLCYIAASEFEAKWKSFSRKLPRKKKNENSENQVKYCSPPLLQYRQAALKRVEGSLDCRHLEIDWHLSPFWFTDPMTTAIICCSVAY